MKTEQEEQSVAEEWQAAQAALSYAQALPGGHQRFEALKRAGQLRYEADERRRSIEEEMDRNRSLVAAGLKKLR
jgi:hypothetical protein